MTKIIDFFRCILARPRTSQGTCYYCHKPAADHKLGGPPD